jgi:ubiquitin
MASTAANETTKEIPKDENNAVPDANTSADMIDSASNSQTSIQEDEWKAELARLEYEIQTLKSVLVVKNREAAALKKKLGITPMREIKQDLQYGLQTVKESGAYQKTSSALKNIGSFASQKLVNIRNSNTFKSVEEKVGGAYASVKQSQSLDNLKARLSRTPSSKSEDHIDASAEEEINGQSDEPAGTNTKLPEDKVPL